MKCFEQNFYQKMFEIFWKFEVLKKLSHKNANVNKATRSDVRKMATTKKPQFWMQIERKLNKKRQNSLQHYKSSNHREILASRP